MNRSSGRNSDFAKRCCRLLAPERAQLEQLEERLAFSATLVKDLTTLGSDSSTLVAGAGTLLF